MANILISGCSGFLAAHLLDRLQRDAGHRLFGFTEVAGFSRPGLQVFQCDIRAEAEVAAVVEKVKPDIVFHCAAVTNVAVAWKQPRLTYEVNFIGSGNLFEALRRRAPASRTVLMSSAEIYDKSGQPLTETAVVACRNPYSLSKRAMEMLADLYVEAHQLALIKVRSFNFTGPGQERRFVASDFAAQIAACEKGRHQPLLRVGNLEAVRDFSDVRDIARYLDTLAQQGRPGETYNLCSGASYPIRRILEILLSLARCKISVETDPDKFRPLDAPFMAGDAGKIRREFGLQPQIGIEQTLHDLLEFWRAAV